MSSRTFAGDRLDEPPYGPRVIRSHETGGIACVGPNRTPVSEVLRRLAAGQTREQIVAAEAGLESEDIDASLAFAAWMIQED